MTILDRFRQAFPDSPVDTIDLPGCGQRHDDTAPLTVRENLEMGGYLLGRAEIAERVGEVLAVFPKLGSMLRRPAASMRFPRPLLSSRCTSRSLSDTFVSCRCAGGCAHRRVPAGTAG